MARPNGNGNGQGAPRGRRRKAADERPPDGIVGYDDDPAGGAPEDAAAEDAPAVYESASFGRFVANYDRSLSDLRTSQADIRELTKAEAERGMPKAAWAFYKSLRAKIANDKQTPAGAVELLDSIRWMLEQEFGNEIKGDLVRRMEEADTSPPI